MKSFPKTEVAGISLPRMLIGTNWMLGWSHTSPSADKMIKNRFSTKEKIAEIIEAYLKYDINAVMGLFYGNEILLDGIHLAEERTGRKVIIIDTPVIDVNDSRTSRESAKQVIKYSADIGADFCLLHHSCAEQLVNKLHGTLDRLPDYTYMIREAGMIPGLSAHMPELILYSDDNEYDVQTYIQLYNCMGFLMQVEVEAVARIIHNAKKPVMAIKSMAAGRISPYIGITFAYSTLRPCDMVTIGAYTADEVHEDVEIAMAAIERRFPDMDTRNSPNKTKVLGGE
ncbi:MAG: hypothetical protein R3232_02770 [Clostridia bacterium]|nr:hypothetical protein [Clostridia bacterium]